ncbi:MAG: helix-turn-helix domain-containing protein, partial [Candidatus Acidiferrum sp.]
LERTPDLAVRFGQTSTLTQWRDRADRRRSNLRTPLGYAEGGFEVRDESLSRLLVVEEESLNRLHNIVSQVGLRILFFDEKERFAGRYGSATKGGHQAAYAEQPDNRGSPKRVKSCLAAPIFDAESGLLGFLDALPTHGELTGEASTLASTVMRTTARAIEERSFRKRYRREWIIALAPSDGGDYGLLLAVDGQQRIVGADRHAGSTLSASNVNLGSGPTLWALFEKDAALFRDRNLGDIYTTVVTVGSAQIWNAIVTPPISRALHQHVPEYTGLHFRPRLDSIGCVHSSAPPDYSVGGLAPRALQRVREYVEEHLSENIELETLADIAGLSKWHFARAFKQSVGTPPHFYLVQRRLERAQELLAETDLPLAQIALKIGFSDQSHFSRRFRTLLGLTPRSFRRSKR